MHSISEHQVIIGLIILAVVIALGRGAGDFARRVNQPEVLGQLFAGFLLGPSIFGALLPGPYHFLFSDPMVGTALSLFSWVGAILLLLMAGIEVDLGILRQEAKPGAFAAAFAIIPSVIVGTLFGRLVLGSTYGIFLGIVLSVTGMSVIAKILMERGEMRRRYAQVILAAGIASEIVVWLMVSVASSLRHGSPFEAGAISSAYAIAFFLVMITIGRRFVFWTMRRVADLAPIGNGELSLVLVFTFGAAAVTQALGLHALLGAFVVGVVLTQSPRTNARLEASLQSLTTGLFAPIFFVLAGMRINIFQLGGVSAIGTVLLLLIVATVVKIGLSALGARLGGLRTVEAGLVGVGLNLKGGTDVIVAIVGRELGLLTGQAFTMYAVVALLTVMASPFILNLLASHAPPSDSEQERLEREEASRQSYMPHLERVLVPLVPELLPTLASGVVRDIALAKHHQGQLMDIVEIDVDRQMAKSEQAEMTEAGLSDVGDLDKVAVTRQRARRGFGLSQPVPGEEDTVRAILAASNQDDLIAIGARPPKAEAMPSLGRLAETIVHQSKIDVLVAIDHEATHFDSESVKRILVPINGLEYSLAAGDLAGYLAQACNAELVIMSVVSSTLGEGKDGADEQRFLRTGQGVVEELRFRLSHIGISVKDRVVVSDNAGQAIVEELTEGEYNLVVMGAIDRGRGEESFLGTIIQKVVYAARVPAVLLVSRRTPETAVSQRV